MQTTSSKGKAFIQLWEGLRLRAYVCPARKLTIGYGHTGKDVKPDMEISLARAEQIFQADVEIAEWSVRALVRVPLKQNQFDALVSFAFNLGRQSLAGSTLLKLLNDGDYESAAEQFSRWCKFHDANRKVKEDLGLKRRRLAERALFQN